MALGSVIGEAFVEIRPELSRLYNETQKGVTEAIDKANTAQSGSFDKLANAGKLAFAGLATAAIGFGAVAVKEALEGEKAHALLEASVKAAGGSMEALEPKIDKLTDRFAKLGFTNDELEQGLARLTQITQNPTKAIDLMGVTADLAAARHISLEQAATLVGRAAEGNVTPLKRMGVTIQATGDSAKDGAAAIAALQQRFGGSAQAEADTYAGKLKAFQAEMTNLEEKIGNDILPVLAKLAGGLADTVGFFERNHAAATALAVVVGGPLTVAMSAYVVQQGIAIAMKVADFFETVGIAALYAADGIKGAALAAKDFVVSLAAAIGPVELAAAAVGLLTGAISFNSTNTKDAKDAATQYVQALKGAGDEIPILKDRIAQMSKARDDEFLATEKAAVAHGNWAEVSGKARAQYDRETAAINTLKDRVKELTTQHQSAKQATEDLTAAQEKHGNTLDDISTKTGVTTATLATLAEKMKIDLTKATDDQVSSLEQMAERLQETDPAALALRDALDKLRDSTVDAKDKVSAFKDALDRLIGGNLDAEKAVVSFQDKIDGLGAKLKANGNNLDAHTKAGRDNLTMIEDVVSATRTHIEALQAQGASAEELRAAFNGDTQALRDQLTQAGLTKNQIDALLQSYGLVPSNLTTIIDADTSLAQTKIQALLDWLKANADTILTPFESGSAKKGRVTRMAVGGIVDRPQFALIGEAGPELVLPLKDPRRMAELLADAHRGGQLSGLSGGASSPAAITAAPLAAGPAVHIENVNVTEARDGRQSALDVARQIRGLVYTQTGR